jgi:hypothetical protein
LSKDVPLRFEAEDSVGNKTRGYLLIASSKISKNLSAYPRMAFAERSEGLPSLPMMTLPPPPSFRYLAAVGTARAVSQTSDIDFRGLRDRQSMFFDTLSVEGAVWATEGIQGLSINGQSLLSLKEDESGASFLKLLQEKKGRSLAFSKMIQLEEGENTITASLTDTTGEGTKKAITVTRKIPKVKQISSRMRVATFPFTERRKTEESMRNYVYTFLTHAFVDQKRFNVLGRTELKKALEEQQINQDAVFDQKTAIRLSRLMGSETVLIGDLTVSEKSVEIAARLIDTETSFILAEKDVYWEGGLDAGFKEILDGLALKFKQHIPLCEGTVIEEKSGKVTINLGSDQSIIQAMRFLAFYESDPTYDPVTGMNLGKDTEILGLLSAKEIDYEFSQAEVLKMHTRKGIHTGDMVISK